MVDCRHCIEKWLNTPDSKAQCPMDRQPWGIFPFWVLVVDLCSYFEEVMEWGQGLLLRRDVYLLEARYSV